MTVLPIRPLDVLRRKILIRIRMLGRS